MSHRPRLAVLAAVVLLAVSACSSGGSDAADTTSAKATTTAPDRTTTTKGTATTDPGDTSDTKDTTKVSTPDELPSCQDLLTEYANRFTMDDLTDAAAFFREYAPLMPKDVGDASIRIAEAYEAADGDPANLDFSDVDLTADAQVFSDWTNEGCPAG